MEKESPRRRGHGVEGKLVEKTLEGFYEEGSMLKFSRNKLDWFFLDEYQ